METIIQIIFALLALGFLVFVHELGHYIVARRVGMTVEVFSIGFGRPIHSWIKDGVKWQIGWLPFGGYVRIAGTDLSSTDKRDPYQIPDGFFGKKPLDRIKVAVAGPLANILIAIVLFAIIWLFGGRDKPFSEFTHRIGWVDPKSELYQKGIRPGDVISQYNGKQLTGFKDLIYATMLSKGAVDLHGHMINPLNGEEKPFNIQVQPYQMPSGPEGLMTVGILSPARYLVYDRFQDNKDNPLPDGSPMKASGIQYGDQIVWANGDKAYSLDQLSNLINTPHALLTIERGSSTFVVRVPRIQLDDLKLDIEQKGELTDWQHQAGLKTKFSNLYFIPYNLNSTGIVENRLSFIDPELKTKAFPEVNRVDAIDLPLQPGDKIIAVNKMPVSGASEVLTDLQEQRVLLIVRRQPSSTILPNWQQADQLYKKTIDDTHIQTILSQLGTNKQVTQSGDYYLLEPVEPRTILEFASSAEHKALIATEILEQKKKIEEIADPEKRAKALRSLEDSQNRLILGIPLQDRQVNYNPGPQVLFSNVFVETWRTLLALFSGYLNPKWLSGPVGIVSVIQHGWSIGVKEAFFWIAAISVNLAVLNLLPIPFLDGGHILFSAFEMVTGKRIKPKVLERLILPFVIILIGFILFVTYYDITRLF